MSENVFTMAGDVGDAVYAMCAMKHLGGGHLVFWPKPYVRSPMTYEKVKSIELLFALQPYVKSVQFNAGSVFPNYNLDDFRDRWARLRKTGAHSQYSICELQLATFNLPLRLAQEKWIDVEPRTGVDVVFSRSPRYRGPDFPWRRVYEKYVDAGTSTVVFLGTCEEAHQFNSQVGKINWVPTSQLIHAARILAGARLLVSNQNAIGSLAAAMNIPWLQESWPLEKNCIFDCVTPGMDANVELPELALT